MTDIFLDRTAAVLSKVLDGASARQNVLADNIANADTPKFTRHELTFEGQLHAAIDEPVQNPDQQIADIAGVPLSDDADLVSPVRGDGNNVDIEREMTELAKNSLQFETAAQIFSMRISALKNAIREGK